MRDFVTVKLNKGTFIHLIPEFSQAICSHWKSKWSFNLSSTTNIRSWRVFPSLFNLNICTINCTRETERIFWEKAALNPLVSCWSQCHSNLVFVEERPDLHMPLQQTNEQTPTTLKWIIEFTHIFFPRRLLNEQR